MGFHFVLKIVYDIMDRTGFGQVDECCENILKKEHWFSGISPTS